MPSGYCVYPGSLCGEISHIVARMIPVGIGYVGMLHAQYYVEGIHYPFFIIKETPT